MQTERKKVAPNLFPSLAMSEKKIAPTYPQASQCALSRLHFDPPRFLQSRPVELCVFSQDWWLRTVYLPLLHSVGLPLLFCSWSTCYFLQWCSDPSFCPYPVVLLLHLWFDFVARFLHTRSGFVPPEEAIEVSARFCFCVANWQLTTVFGVIFWK